MNTADVLTYGHQTVLQTLEDLPQESWDRSGACGIWSVKDIIAHLASFEHLLVDVLNSLLNDSPTPTLTKFREDYVAFNDNEVIQRQDNTIDEVWAEYNDTHAKTMTLIRQIPAELCRQNGLLCWYGPDYDLDDFITYTYYGHKREHAAQIALFRDQLIKS